MTPGMAGVYHFLVIRFRAMRSFLMMAVVLVSTFFCPLTWSFGQSQKQGLDLFREGREIQQKAVTRQDKEFALSKYEHALRIFEHVGYETGAKTVLMNMGYIYGALNEHKEALETYQKSLVLIRKAGSPKQEGITLNNMGSSEKALGNYDQALELFAQALGPLSEAGDLKSQGSALNNIADIYNNKGKYKEAIDYYEKSLAIKKQIGDKAGEATTINNLALIYSRTSQYKKALDNYFKALETYREVGNRREEAAALNNIASVYRSYGLYQTALNTFRDALAINQKIGDTAGEAANLNGMALVYMTWGRYRLAEDTFERVLVLAQKLSSPKLEMTAVNNIGETYYHRGQYQKGLNSFKEAMVIAKRLGDQRAEATILSNMAEVYRASGQVKKALELHGVALETRKVIDDKTGQSASLSNMGEILRDLGKYRDALRNYTASAEIRESLGLDYQLDQSRIIHLFLDVGMLDDAKKYAAKSADDSVLGRFWLKSSEYSKAKTAYSRLLGKAEKSQNANQLFVAYTALGAISELQGDLATAETFYEKAVKLTEEMRSGLLPSERKNFFEVKIDGFYRFQPAKGLSRIRMMRGRPQQSLESSELVRARAFSDHLGYAGLPENILREEDEALTTLAALKKTLSSISEEQDPEKFLNIQQLVVTARQRLDDLIEKLRKDYPHYASVKYPRPLSLKQALLRPDEHIVYLDFLGEGVGVILIRGSEVLKSFYRPWPLDDLLQSISTLRMPFETFELEKFDPELASRIYRKLLGGVLDDVPAGTPLCIIPDGPLGVIPFEALITSGTASWKQGEQSPYPQGVTYLGDVYPISYEKSLVSMSLSRLVDKSRQRTSKDRMLVLADPVFKVDDPRVKGTAFANKGVNDALSVFTINQALEQTVGGSLEFNRAKETGTLAENLTRLYGKQSLALTGFKATKAIFLEELAPHLEDYKWVVFATHGVFMGEIPGLEPFLALTTVPPGTDGFLTLSDVLGLQMNAEVVALTACQTGLGRYISGEGFMSMGRAFQYAGARTVLMSLWSVAESSSVLLMKTFFEHLKNGCSKSESLQRARTDIRKAGYEHPFFWTPFILVGEIN